MSKQKILTSQTNPLYVNFINWKNMQIINASIPKGQLGMTFAPGKKAIGTIEQCQWDRNLELDLDILKNKYKVDILYSFMLQKELEQFNISNLQNSCKSVGIQNILFEIIEGSVPQDMEEFNSIIELMAQQIQEGKVLVVHCRGGLGRTGLAAACCLIKMFKISSEQSMEIVRKERPSTIENQNQEQFIREFEQYILKKKSQL